MKKQLLLAISLLIFCAAATAAQVNTEQAVINARAQLNDIKNRSIELERVKREANKRPADENYTPKFPEIKIDFEQIQNLNSDIFKLNTIKTPTNYSAVLRFVSEINHRAVRLKSNLFSADLKEKKELKDKQQPIAESPDMKILLANLDKSINSFVHNPMFQNINIVSSEDSLKAQKDLENIIKISYEIKEKAKKLAKDDAQK